MDDAYYPKPQKPWLSFRYLLREQRLHFLLLGIVLATLFFFLLPSGLHDPFPTPYLEPTRWPTNSPSYDVVSVHSVGKIPLGIKRKGLRIVVTGGAGFVGGGSLDCPRRQRHRRRQFLHRKERKLLIHKTNVVGTLNMLGLAKRVGARFLLTSTSEVYGDPLEHPQKETYWGNVNPIGVRSCYDEGKRTAETLTMDYHRGAGVEVRIARIFNTYGPRMCLDDGRVVSNFVAQALRKEPLTVYGDGKQTRSFQYVSDLVEGLMRLMEGEHVGPFNLGNPGEFTMLELAKVVQETIDPEAKIEYRPNTEDDPHKRKPDISRAKEQLGWEPKVDLRKGLPLMVSDFRQRIFGDQKEGTTSA
ncbi:UDP-glucuronic acid decarboxylase 1 [Glycine soja]|nr:UDP-glucuronic acid decarboxylase 1 [Glycine soja]